MTLVAYAALEDAFFARHGMHLLAGNVRPLFPTLSDERLISLLTTSRALWTETADPTLMERAVVFLLMRGWICPTLKRVGRNILKLSSTNILRGADVLRCICIFTLGKRLFEFGRSKGSTGLCLMLAGHPCMSCAFAFVSGCQAGRPLHFYFAEVV